MLPVLLPVCHHMVVLCRDWTLSFHLLLPVLWPVCHHMVALCRGWPLMLSIMHAMLPLPLSSAADTPTGPELTLSQLFLLSDHKNINKLNRKCCKEDRDGGLSAGSLCLVWCGGWRGWGGGGVRLLSACANIPSPPFPTSRAPLGICGRIIQYNCILEDIYIYQSSKGTFSRGCEDEIHLKRWCNRGLA